MSRKFKSPDRFLKPDPQFRNLLAAKFINNIMKKGKKSVAEKTFYDAINYVGKKVSGKEPIEVFKAAVENVKPRVEVHSRRVGGATYQVPVEVNKKRQLALSIRWILTAARKRKGMPMWRRLGEEFVAAYRDEGEAMKTKDNVRRMAEANKAFAHLRW